MNVDVSLWQLTACIHIRKVLHWRLRECCLWALT